MDTKEIMALIEYKRSILLPILEEEDDPPELSSQVVKLDRGRLLVKVESGIELLAENAAVELEVPTSKALFRIVATVERMVRTSEGASIVHLLVDDIEQIQRRKQDRFLVNYPCTFIPMREGEKPSDLVGRASGLGRVVNLSLGGIQFETEYDLPVGLLVHLDVRMPSGRLDFQGRIVTKSHVPLGMNSYGAKFSRMDAVTSQRLNRLILNMERRERRENRSRRRVLRIGGGRTPLRNRLRRFGSDRWDKRDARRRRRRR